MNAALQCTGVDVRFGAVHALREVSLTFEQGKIHALLGQNGAGKSTLARAFSGVLVPRSGRLQIASRDVAFGDAAAAQAAGLDIVHQRPVLPPGFSVSEALEFASARKMGGPFYSRRGIDAAWQDRLNEAGIQVSTSAKLSSLPVETAQAIEITRALANEARVLILDEPTALLPPEAIDAFFDQLRTLRDAGVTLIVILHKLKEVMALADTVSILRQGDLVLSPTPIQALDEDRIRDLMIGTQDPARASSKASGKSAQGAELLRFKNVTSLSKGQEPGLNGASFDVRSGEILGVAGVEGNGQRALAEVYAGLTSPTRGSVLLSGSDITGMNVAERRSAGLRVVPFDRMTEGASLTLSLWENMRSWVADAFRHAPWPLASLSGMRADTAADLNRFGVVHESVNQLGGTLSGGNLQRLILARELAGDISAVLAAQPTRGLDFRATQFVREELNRVRNSGAGVMLISSDLDELFGICDRILVIRGGSVTGMFERDFSRSEIGRAMVGGER
ncbi:MAG: ATP-binding cassette domain-containing protein [Boseongicola sp. SB0676_bin_33]|nr:ATP-binding cassette domain-containing protein [Boseongicola sp. SB0676_bin_33]